MRFDESIPLRRSMLRSFSVILLLIVFGSQSFRQTVVMAEYYINKAAFEKNCENKARPTLHCNGKCQMMKKLEQEEKKNGPQLRLENKIEVVSSKTFFTAGVAKPASFVSNRLFIFAEGSCKGTHRDVFRPPLGC